MTAFRGWALAAILTLAGCSSGSSLVPDKALHLTGSAAVKLSSLAAGVAVAGAVYAIYDPLAPNWEIEESRVGADTYRFSLTMKRFHTGGAGEALQVLKRRAGQLKSEQGYGGYLILEYAEGIDSQTLGARRVAEGAIKLVQRQEADSFNMNTIY